MALCARNGRWELFEGQASAWLHVASGCRGEIGWCAATSSEKPSRANGRSHPRRSRAVDPRSPGLDAASSPGDDRLQASCVWRPLCSSPSLSARMPLDVVDDPTVRA